MAEDVASTNYLKEHLINIGVNSVTNTDANMLIINIVWYPHGDDMKVHILIPWK
jgi:hypothetical protein